MTLQSYIERGGPVEIHTMHEIQALMKGARIDAGLSQQELATQAGVSRKWVSEFERGKASIELPMLLRLFHLLGLHLSAGHQDDAPSPAGGSHPRPPERKVMRAGTNTPIDLDVYLEGFSKG